MRQRTSIVLASILKPVDDTRMFEKLGLSLGQTNKYDVNIIGFASKNLKKFDNLHFYPLFTFRRTSLMRLFAPFRLLLLLFKVKPSIVIFNTPEILYVIIFYKLITGCAIIYDVQENYFRNVYYNKNYILPFRFLLAYAIRFKEWSGRWLIDRIIFAEEGYKVEMPRSAKRAAVIRNTYRDLDVAGLGHSNFGDDKDHEKIRSNDQNKQELSGGRSIYDRRSDDIELNGGGITDENSSVTKGSVKIGTDSKNLKGINSDNQRLHSNNLAGSEYDLKRPYYEGSNINKPLNMEKISGTSETRDNARSLAFLFSGTISDNYGVFTAINFIDAMHAQYPLSNLLIAGFCPNERILRKLLTRIENKPYIKLIGGDHLVPHQDIIKYIQEADFGLICYEINPSIENCFPTKIYEYIANRLPVIIQDYKPWSSYCLKHKAGIEIDYQKINSEILLNSLKTEKFYTAGVPEEIFWNKDEEKLLKLVEDIQS